MVKYQCVATGKIYSEKQMKEFFKYKEYRGYTGTCDDWIKSELDSGYIINYTGKTTALSLEEIFEYAKQHNLKYNELHFKHFNGKEFVLIDADQELFRMEGTSGFVTFEDLERSYENEQVFNIC